jgi:hypothetical protein
MLVFLVATTFVSHVYGCLSSESPPAARLREAASSYGNGGWNQKAQPKKIARAGEVLSAGAIPSEVLRIATGSNEADGSSNFLGFQDKSDLGNRTWDTWVGTELNRRSGGKRCPESRLMKGADVNGRSRRQWRPSAKTTDNAAYRSVSRTPVGDSVASSEVA